MKTSKKIASLKALAIMVAFSVSSGAYAQNNLAPQGGAADIGSIFRNLTAGLGSFGGLMEAVLYIVGAVFSVMTLLKLYKWNKSDGRDATLGGIGVTFLVAVLGFTMPMLISSGTSQIWGQGAQVRTVTPPPAFR